MGFAKALKTLREKTGLTQKELASSLGISTASVIHYEQGKKKPSFDALLAIGKQFNVSIDEMLGIVALPRTWADYAKMIVSFGDQDDDMYCIDLKHIEGDTYGIIFPGHVVFDPNPATSITDPVQVSLVNPEDYAHHDILDNPLAKFMSEYIKIRELYKSGVIDRGLFDLWLEKTQSDLDQPISIVTVS